ncbi:MlaD family protein [Negadavirga shengliensis]|uniref:MlaD family protein n=1 Tax=Negadavirga shengliensis TaxID=1389218 RepID=A0ABV9T6S1_9BACT
MNKKKIENAKVGLFVLAGLLFLVLTLYMIGRNQHLFKPTFTLKAVVNNVYGLVPGNNVRFKGMDVGTVKNIEMAGDTSIYITMVINNSMKPHIKKNAVTFISTDGLMGNKLIQINPQEGYADAVKDGDIIYSQTPVETEEMLKSLNNASYYIENTAMNLYEVTSRLNNNHRLWDFLNDSSIMGDLRNGIAEFSGAAKNASELTQSGKNMLSSFQEGNGLVYRIFLDTALSQDLAASLELIHQASKDASLVMEEARNVVNYIGRGDGPVGLLLTDSLFRETIINSAQHIEEGSDSFNQNMEALKRNFLFRRYFRRQAREQKKSIDDNK